MIQSITGREREVLELVAHEYTTPQIASQLYLSTHTVDSHKKNLKSKLEVKNTAGMVRRGFELGLLKIVSGSAAQVLILAGVFLSMTFTMTGQEFVTQWQTTSNGESITITINPNASGSVKYDIDWGDGSPPQISVTTSVSHTYAVAGKYDVKISGDFPGIQVNIPASNASKLLLVKQWGSIQWTTMRDAFSDASEMVISATDAPDLSKVTNTGRMFEGCTKLNSDINHWDMSNVTTAFEMFANCSTYNQPLNNWDVSIVTDMNEMFRNASSFDQSLGDWEIFVVGEMSDMLAGTAMSVANYDATIIGWAGLQQVESGVEFGVSGLTYCSSASQRQSLIDDQSWDFDDDMECFSGARPFVTKWQIDDASQSLTITTTAGLDYLYNVDWENDGVIDFTGVVSDVSHTYPVPGTYDVAIFGQFPRPRMAGTRLKEIVQWGDIAWDSLSQSFSNASHMIITATDAPDLREVTSLESMFEGCDSLTADINHWDVSSIKNMRSLFIFADRFNSPLDNWDVSNVTNMTSMFRSASTFDQPLNSWNVSSVTYMVSMFERATNFNQSLDGWDVSNVTNMQEMFRDAVGFNQVMGSWNPESVTTMSNMFRGASNFNQPIGNWNVSNVTTMSSMFSNATAFNQPIGNWNVSNVTTMSSMFFNAAAFNQPIGNWNVSNVTSMSFMFSDAAAFNQPIRNWNTFSAQSMRSMFSGATSFNQDLPNWNTQNVTTMERMFRGAVAFDGNIGNWNTQNVTTMSGMFKDATSFNQPIGNWNTSSVTNMSSMFFNNIAFNQPIGNWNTQNVTTMDGMFEDAISFNQDISDWDVSQVTDMDDVFNGATAFNQDIGDWDVSNARSFERTFRLATSFDQNIGAWDLSSANGSFSTFSMLDFSGLSITSYDSTLIGWLDQGIMNIQMGARELQYCIAENARQALIDNFGWIITDSGRNCNVRPCIETQANLLETSIDWHSNRIRWSQGAIPGVCDEVVIPFDISTSITTDDAECFSIEIENGGQLEVMVGRQLEVWVDE